MKPKRILIVDALNMYFRAYIVNPSLSTSGQPIGGLKGFLGILNKLVREMRPDQIVICWDGPGGSQNRKATNKNYKEGRSPIRLNRDVRNLSAAEEVANKIWQQTRLFEYLNEMPIVQFLFEHVEADDIISHVANCSALRGAQKIIVSSDKDFFQLLDDETVLYRPIQKEWLNKKRVVDMFGIHPLNFALARAVVGDKSDNLHGVRGVGLGTIAKRFPFMGEEVSYTIDHLVSSSEEQCQTGLKCYTSICEQRLLIEENYKLMQLYSPALSIQAKQYIGETFEHFLPQLNKTQILKMFVEDGIADTQVDSLYSNFKKLIRESK
jgi:DNA polymerase-1